MEEEDGCIICFHEKWIICKIKMLEGGLGNMLIYCADCYDTYHSDEELGIFSGYGYDLEAFNKIVEQSRKEYKRTIEKGALLKEFLIPKELLWQRIGAVRERWPEWIFEPVYGKDLIKMEYNLSDL